MIIAVVPAKAFGRAKSRLSGPLDADGRADAARAMFDRVVGRASTAFDAVVVVTDGLDVRAAAAPHGARVVSDPTDAAGLADIVDAGLAEAERMGAETAVVLMADLPLLEDDDLEALREAARRHPVVLAPDHHGQHTNALVLSPPTRFPTCFGHARSLEMHARQARHPVAYVRRPGLAHDLDHPNDLASLHARLHTARTA